MPTEATLHHPHRTCGPQGTNLNMMLMQPAVLWGIKSLVSDPGVSCLLPASTKPYQDHLLVCKQGKTTEAACKGIYYSPKTIVRETVQHQGKAFWERAGNVRYDFSLSAAEGKGFGWLEYPLYLLGTAPPTHSCTLCINKLRYAFWIQRWMWTLFFHSPAPNPMHNNITLTYHITKQVMKSVTAVAQRGVLWVKVPGKCIGGTTVLGIRKGSRSWTVRHMRKFSSELSAYPRDYNETERVKFSMDVIMDTERSSSQNPWRQEW